MKGYTAGIRNEEKPCRNLGAEQVIYFFDSFRKQQHPIMFAIVVTFNFKMTKALLMDCISTIQDENTDMYQ